MKYFVTGATGFVGGRLVHALRSAGHQVNALVRAPEKAEPLRAQGVSLYVGDVTQKESLRAGMQGVDGIFHVAGWYMLGAAEKRFAQSVNVQGTRNVLEVMRELGVPKGVYTSTLAIHSDTHGLIVDESHHFNGKYLSEYDRTKALAHDLAVQRMGAGLPLVVVMPGVIYGPGDTSSFGSSLVAYLSGKLPIVPRKTAICLTHVDDVVQAHLLAMQKGRLGEVYHTAGLPVTLVEVFQLAQQITGIKAPTPVPPAWLRVLSVIMGLVEKVIRLPEAYTAEGLRVAAGVTYLGNSSKARRELGFHPRPLREGLEETLLHEQSLLAPKTL